MKLARRARVKIELASRAGNRKAIVLLTGSDKKLQRFIRMAENSASLDRMSDDLMHSLTGRARTARTITQGLRALLQTEVFDALRLGQRVGVELLGCGLRRMSGPSLPGLTFACGMLAP